MPQPCICDPRIIGMPPANINVSLRSAGKTVLCSLLFRGGGFFHLVKIAFFAAGHETFGHGFEFLPAGADLLGLGGRDLIVRRSGGDDLQKVGKFLDDLVGRGNQEMWMRRVLGIEDEEAAGALAEPLDKPMVAGALKKRLDAVERIFKAPAT